MKNWKTSLTGLLLAVVIAVEPIVAKGEVSWPAVGMAALVAALGFLSKDYDATGGTREVSK